MNDLSLTEEMFLLSVWKLGKKAYGVTIRRHVSRTIKRTYPYGTLYSSLDKLTRKGFLEKVAGDPTPERGGRSKNFYSITEEGILALKKALELKKVLWDKETELALKES